jgi:hypothetical protein
MFLNIYLRYDNYHVLLLTINIKGIIRVINLISISHSMMLNEKLAEICVNFFTDNILLVEYKKLLRYIGNNLNYLTEIGGQFLE